MYATMYARLKKSDSQKFMTSQTNNEKPEMTKVNGEEYGYSNACICW
jgi:hypothetical protein